MYNLLLYHGTDYNIAQQIRQTEFISKPNKEHWLGNGIYFYLDEMLAKWWTTNPTSRFSSKIENPAVIKVALTVQNQYVLDLRKMSDFNRLIIWEHKYKEKVIKELWGNEKGKRPNETEYLGDEYRCRIFDEIYQNEGVRVIIGCFHKPDQPYVPKELKRLNANLDLTYTEVQVCVRQEFQKENLKIIDINRKQ